VELQVEPEIPDGDLLGNSASGPWFRVEEDR